MTEIFTGGEIVTLDPTRPEAEAVAVRDGVIVGINDTQTLWGENANATEINIAGGCLIPSLIDHHLHLTAIGLSLLNQQENERLFLQLAGASSSSAIVDRVRNRATQVPKGDWILGMGWNQHDWGTHEFPSHEELSDAVPDHPVFLVRIDAHSAWVNQAALARAKISGNTPAPLGGAIQRAANGAPTGILLERAVEPILEQIPVAAGWEIREAFKLASKALAERGVTEVFDAGFMASPAIVSMGVDFELMLELLTWADAEDPLPIDVNLMIPSPSKLADKIVGSPGAYVHLSPRIRVTHIKLYADGAFGSRGAALSHPYADDPNTAGLMRMTDDELEFETRRALEAGLDISTHAIGDDAVRRVLRAYTRVADDLSDVDPRRFRIEHFGYSSLEDQRIATERGFLVVTQPNFIDPDDNGGTMEDCRLGTENGERVYPWRTLSEAGANLALSSDYYTSPGPALLDFYTAHTRANRAGMPPRGWQPHNRLTREGSLRIATSLCPMGGGIPSGGIIRIGVPANLAVLSANPLTTNESDLLSIGVQRTLRRGKVTHRS